MKNRHPNLFFRYFMRLRGYGNPEDEKTGTGKSPTGMFSPTGEGGKYLNYQIFTLRLSGRHMAFPSFTLNVL